MGKKQQAPRTKGNAKAANSERTAALLSSTDGKLPPMTAFFPTLASPSVKDSEVELSVDEDFRLAIKKLWKKDAITRLKALQQISTLLETKTEEDIKGMLPFWPRNFNRLAVDSDRRVRETTFCVHQQLCGIIRRNLAPFMKGLLAVWVAGMYDSHAPAASAARASFEAAFPPFKHANVFLFYLRDTFQQLRETLFNLTVATVPDAAELDEVEREVKFTRMLTGTLHSFAHIINTFAENGEPLDENISEKLTPLVTALVSEPKFWKFAKHTDSGIRAAFYRLLASAVAVRMVNDLDKATKVTLGCLSEQDPVVCLAIWETSLQLLKSNPDCWQHLNLQKAFMPQLNTALKNRCYGNASTIFPLLLPLYVRVPPNAGNHGQILANLREGLTGGVTALTPFSELNSVATALCECLRYDIIYRTQNEDDIMAIFTSHLMPVLRSLLIPPESASESSTRVRRSRFFVELQSLLIFLEKRSLESAQNEGTVDRNEKYKAIGSIWECIYSLSVESLESGSLNALAEFYTSLYTSHSDNKQDDIQRKSRKGVRFAAPGAANESAISNENPSSEKRASSGSQNPMKNSKYEGICHRFLGRLLESVRANLCIETVQLFSSLFSLCCTDNKFLDAFEKNVLSGRSLSSEMENLIGQQKEVAPFAVKVILRTASVRGETHNEPSTMDVLHKHSQSLLLVILSEAFECDEQNVHLLRSYFEKGPFKATLEQAVKGSTKWDVIQASLHICGKQNVHLFPDSIVEWLVSQLIEVVSKTSPKAREEATESAEVTEEILQFCDVVHSLFDFSVDAWSLPGIETLIKLIYKESVEWGEVSGLKATSHLTEVSSVLSEDDVAALISGRLREIWAGALTHYDHQLTEAKGRSVASDCHRDLIDDAKLRLLSATKVQTKILITTCLELVGDDVEDLTFLKRLVPSAKELENFCLQERIGDRVVSSALARGVGPVILEDGPYFEDVGSDVFQNACHILLEVCHSRKATQLIDINFVLLANFIEPQGRLQAIVAGVVEEKNVAVKVAMDLACRKEPHWHIVLGSLLSSVETLRPNSVWRWNECPANIKQVFIQYERDEEKASELFKETVVEIMSSEENGLDSNLLCLAARCLCRATDEVCDVHVIKLLNSLQGLKGRQPALFTAAYPSEFHLALCRLFIAVLQNCRTALKQINWDFILLSLTSLIETFSWSSPVLIDSSSETVSRVWVGCGVAFSEAAVLMCRFSAEDNERSDIPHDIRHEWRNFYQSVVTQTIVPLLTNAPKKLSKLPGPLLESVAQVYSHLDPQQISKQWPEGDDLCAILNHLCELILVTSLPVQLAAYTLAVRIVGEVAREHDASVQESMEREEDHDDANDPMEKGLPIHSILLECLKDASVSVSMLTKDFNIDDPLPETQLRPKDQIAVSGYLLTCSLVLQFCTRAGREFRGRYIQFLEDQGHLYRYFRNIFVLLPRQLSSSAFSFSLIEEGPTSFSHLISWSLLEACSLVPGVVRSWYMQLNDCKQSQQVERITMKYVSPRLIERELGAVRSGQTRLENVALTVLASTREIQANYILEDVTKRIQISIQMDVCHPLKKILVICNCEQVPVSYTKWRQWLYSLSVFLNENGSIREGLSSWKQNLDRRLEGGTEECCICFSVLHMTTLRLPNYPCRTCKKVFHKTCMYKWLKHGHKTCPACRSIVA